MRMVILFVALFFLETHKIRRNMDTENINQNIPQKTLATPGKLNKSQSLATPGKLSKSLTFVTPGKQTKALSFTTPKASLNEQSISKKSGFKAAPNTPYTPSVTATMSREVARLAKLQNTTERITKVADLKLKWANEKQLKQLKYKQKRETDLKFIQKTSTDIAKKRKENVEAEKIFLSAMKEIEKEAFIAFSEDRSLSINEVKKLENLKRRQSILINTEILLKAKVNHNKIQRNQKEYEIDLLESKRIDYLKLREAKSLEDDKRRESLFHRGEALQIQKKKLAEIKEIETDNEKSIIESRYDNWKDIEAYKKTEELRKRESMAGRLNQWKVQREIEKNLNDYDKDYEIDLMESRHEDWKDIEEYKKSQLQRDRESLAGRLDKWRQGMEYDKWLLNEGK